jgi:hypothetical protein
MNPDEQMSFCMVPGFAFKKDDALSITIDQRDEIDETAHRLVEEGDEFYKWCYFDKAYNCYEMALVNGNENSELLRLIRKTIEEIPASWQDNVFELHKQFFPTFCIIIENSVVNVFIKLLNCSIRVYDKNGKLSPQKYFMWGAISKICYKNYNNKNGIINDMVLRRN